MRAKMIRLKIFAGTFAAIYAAMALATVAIPLSGAFIFWDLIFLNKTIHVLLVMIRGESLIAALIAIAIAFDPYVIASAEEHQKAKDILKSKRKML